MPDTQLALTRHDVIDHLRRHDCAPSSPPLRVGLEQEWHTYAVADPAERLHPDDVLAAAYALGPLPCGSTVTVEPGGQVELATPPSSPWWQALDIVRIDGAALREALASAGIVVVGAGIDPFRPARRTLFQPRYDAMEAFFDAGGPAGRQMMGGSASIQMNVDLGVGTVAAQRWDLAHRIGPALAAAFACSPSPMHRSERLAVWHDIDPSRTRPALAVGDPAQDWVAYVLRARVMLVQDADGDCRPVPGPLTFADWIEAGIDGRRPTLDDLAYHCTTLFPPVRPRGWLELRWLDALPAGLAETAIAAVVALLIDPAAGARAGRVCRPTATAWVEAAEWGPRHPALAQAGAAALRIAAAALDRSGAPAHHAEAVADAAERWPALGRCPADDLEDRLRNGASATDLADPPTEVHRWP